MSRRPRLLVVEDDPAILSLFVAYLEKDGYQVAGAATAASAEAMVKKQEFDLILLDLGLPDEDELVVARRIERVPLPRLSLLPSGPATPTKSPAWSWVRMTTSQSPSTLESFRREFAISLPEPIGAVRGRAPRTSSDSVSGFSISVGTR